MVSMALGRRRRRRRRRRSVGVVQRLTLVFACSSRHLHPWLLSSCLPARSRKPYLGAAAVTVTTATTARCGDCC
jgi:hypothetical protein